MVDWGWWARAAFFAPLIIIAWVLCVGLAVFIYAEIMGGLKDD